MISLLDQHLLEWAQTLPITLVLGTRDVNGVLTYGQIIWPDGATGEFFADSQDATTGAINAWHATYIGDVTRTITQPPVTRDASGGVIAQPQIVIT
ncbi:hypothetical protein [Burkholderia vietnamiensis]|uniref:hypothetical protein n=1 Tax=Burkholderia vietnamiensis TaxID=60552 RepID=UPI001B9E82A6|nr:hypothetical protein [Burkholderia vietnamiensis]MBR8201684.1 hypothetical protein [Burkholderia vietnamiensis]